MLSAGALDYIERFSATFHQTGAGLRDSAPKFDLIEGLQVAIEDRREARILYRSDGDHEATHRVVHPHGMTDHRGALYLVAYDPKGDKIKHYKFDRIEEVEVGRDAPPPPEGFDLESYRAFGQNEPIGTSAAR
jgi:predicted DNA-binding transcriptional regulator YafY